MNDRVWMEVNLQTLQYNLENIRKITNSKIMAVVKDNSYGMGIEVAKYMEDYGIDHFAVATIDEAIQLRELGIKSKILVFGRTSEEELGLLIKYNITQTILSLDYARVINNYGSQINCHLKLDTGMSRNGVEISSSYSEVDEIFTYKNISITGIYTHLSAADINEEEAIIKTEKQLQKFQDTLNYLKSKNIDYGITHVLNTGGILKYNNWCFDYVRPGLLLTGIAESSDIFPVLSIKSRIAGFKERKLGEQIGYGVTSILTRDSKIAVVSVGYGDGIDRRMKGNYVFIDNVPCKIVGNVCMDQIIIDVTDVDCNVNDEVTIFKSDLSLLGLAESYDTIVNELLVRFTARVKRVYINL